MLTVNGNEKEEISSGLVPEHVVPPEHVAEIRPELVSTPPLFVNPVPRREMKFEPPSVRFVVDAVRNDE